MMKESARILVRASSEGGAQLAPSLFHFLIFLIFSPENRCESAFNAYPPEQLVSHLLTSSWQACRTNERR